MLFGCVVSVLCKFTQYVVSAYVNCIWTTICTAECRWCTLESVTPSSGQRGTVQMPQSLVRTRTVSVASLELRAFMHRPTVSRKPNSEWSMSVILAKHKFFCYACVKCGSESILFCHSNYIICGGVHYILEYAVLIEVLCSIKANNNTKQFCIIDFDPDPYKITDFEDVLHPACVLCTHALLSEYKWT